MILFEFCKLLEPLFRTPRELAEDMYNLHMDAQEAVVSDSASISQSAACQQASATYDYYGACSNCGETPVFIAFKGTLIPKSDHVHCSRCGCSTVSTKGFNAY